ncbi:hypothetical protein HGRIS_009646 [Hohenbuehelia grisea]|uniref:Uncharacterized protein n=1 Tax=Hohenbuehelia grisea TaxID=104357 RepID=A0ABR3J1X5_9AGAR
MSRSPCKLKFKLQSFQSSLNLVLNLSAEGDIYREFTRTRLIFRMSDSHTSLGVDNLDSFFANILTPGSSTQPIFLLILDVIFALLLFVLISLAYITSGNVHMIALTAIELGLWASVKWFVYELKKSNTQQLADSDGVPKRKDD